jgi:hypothetical protein
MPQLSHGQIHGQALEIRFSKSLKHDYTPRGWTDQWRNLACVIWPCAASGQFKARPWHANMAEMPSLIAIDRVRSLKVQGDFDKTMGSKGLNRELQPF